MEGTLGTLLGTGWAGGVNLYLTVLLLGLLGRFDIAATPDELQSAPVLVGAGIMFLVELVADKIPFLDSVWDAFHTAVRPVGAAVVGALLAGDADVNAMLGAVTAGGMALGSHTTKAGTRLAVNTSPEPASNIVVSFLEDGAVAAVVWFAVEYPVVAGVVAVVLLVAGLGMLVVLWKFVRRGIARVRRRRSPPRERTQTW